MSIEKELLKLTGLKSQKKKESDQAYLKRILLAIDKTDDEKFFSLSDETQKWIDTAIDAVEEKKDIPSFDADEDENGEDEDEDEDENGEDEDEDEKEKDEEEGEEEEDEEEGEEEDEDEDEDEDEEEDKKENKPMSKKKTKNKETKTRRKSSDPTKEKKKDKKSKAMKDHTSTSTKKKGKKGKEKSEAKKASSSGKGRGRPSENAGKKITVLERKPPLKTGSKRAEMFQAMKKSKTVAAYTNAGGTAKFLSVAVEKGWIKLS